MQNIPDIIENIVIVTLNTLDNTAGPFIMIENTTDEIASRYLWYEINLVIKQTYFFETISIIFLEKTI